MSHASIPDSLKEKLAPPADLIRISIGIEDIDDLIEDLEAAFAAAQNANRRTLRRQIFEIAENDVTHLLELC